MPQADECRTKAQECEEIARQHRELELKQLWEDMAKKWAPTRGEGRKLNHLGCGPLVALSKKWMGIFVGEWPRGAPSPGRPGLSNLPSICTDFCRAEYEPGTGLLKAAWRLPSGPS